MLEKSTERDSASPIKARRVIRREFARVVAESSEREKSSTEARSSEGKATVVVGIYVTLGLYGQIV